MGSFRNLAGQKFGRLMALSPTNKRSGSSMVWRCRCDCGNIHETCAHSLLRGLCRSCGCLRAESARARATKHQMSCSKIYHIWVSMIQRCENPKVSNFQNYGGRGIKVCKRWHKFENFYKDMGDNPEGKSLDRSDNDGNYQPENCKWSTPKEQAQNSRPKSCGFAMQKEFLAVSPDNHFFRSQNQRQFAREHQNLDHRLISNCLRGIQSNHKGWTFSFINPK